MSQTDVVTVLKIETGQSENTIKSIKKEISDLKKVLEGAEIGSEAFEKASRDLAAAQQQLKTVMDSTKKTVSAAEGSYDALVATMAQLKKEWRATSDEAKRNEIGKQIEAINTELKELDATLGNHQRNVGNYKGDIIDAYREIQGEVKKTNGVLAGSAKPIDTVTEAAYDYGKAWSEAQKGTEQTRAKFESVQKMASGLASGFAAVQGAAALFGAENENLEKTLVKVQAAMAIAQGIGGMKDLIEGFTQGKTAFAGATMGLQSFKAEAVATQATMAGTTVATNASTTAVKGFRKALISTGIGAILVGIGVAIAAIVENWDKLTRALGINKKEQKEVNKAIEESIEREKERKNEVNTSVGSIIGKYKLLQRQWRELSSVQEKNEWINKNRDAFNDLGIAINDVNTAQSVFVTNSEAVIKAIKDQAKARAMAKLYEDAIARQYTAQQELEDAQQTAEQKYYSGYKPSDDEAENAGLTTDDYGTRVEEQSLVEQWWNGEGKYKTVATDWVDYGGARKLQNEYTLPFRQSVAAINGEVAKLEEAFVEAEQTAAESAAAVQALGIDYNGDGSGGSSSSSSSTDDPAAEAKKIAERAKQALIDTKQEELAELTRIYNEELALLQQHNIATGDLTKEYLDNQTELLKEIENFEGGNEQEQLTALENFYNERIRIYTEAGVSTVELTAQFEAEKNTIIEYYENQRQEALTQIANDSKTEKELEKQELTNEYNTYLELFKDHKEQMLLVQQWYTDELAKIDEKYKEEKEETDSGTTETHKQTMAEFIDGYGELYKRIREGAGETAANVAIAFTQALSSANQILGEIQAGIDTSTEEGFEKSKKFQIAQATISMAQGILAAISSAMMIPPPMGVILGSINAGTVATVGGIQIANIKKQKFDGSGGDVDAGARVSPNISMADMIPINYTKDVLTDTETAELNKGNRVYVVESDITETQNEVSVKESNSSF